MPPATVMVSFTNSVEWDWSSLATSTNPTPLLPRGKEGRQIKSKRTRTKKSRWKRGGFRKTASFARRSEAFQAEPVARHPDVCPVCLNLGIYRKEGSGDVAFHLYCQCHFGTQK